LIATQHFMSVRFMWYVFYVRVRALCSTRGSRERDSVRVRMACALVHGSRVWCDVIVTSL